MYGKIDGIRILQLLRDLYHSTQGTMSITAYFSKLKILWDELATIDDVILICETDIVVVAASKEKQKLIQFLIGLNETYVDVHMNLLMRHPLPSLNLAYSVMLQEECQRSLSGFSNFRGHIYKYDWLCTHCGRKGHRVDTYWKKYRSRENMKRKLIANHVIVDDIASSFANIASVLTSYDHLL